jgi:hypothetical protein
MGLMDLFSDNNEAKARDEYTRGYTRARTRALGNLGQGERDLRGQYGQAHGYFDPLYDRYNRGSEMYSNALGLGGDAGNEAATDAFQAGPGYDWAVGQGMQGIMRNASSLGNIASGNTAMALQDRGNQLANQEYGGWLDRLSGYDPLAMSAAGAQGSISTGLGDRLLGLAGDRAGINWAADTGIGGVRGDYQKGKDQTGANIFGGIMGGLNLGAKLLGGGFGSGMMNPSFTGFGTGR